MCVVGSLSSVSATAATRVQPSSTLNTGAHDVSAAQPVKQPFTAAGDWNVSAGFKFGALTSQPSLDTTSSSNHPTQPSDAGAGACSVVSIQSAAVSATNVMSVMSTVSQLFSAVHSATAVRSPVTASTVDTSSQRSGMFASTLMSDSKQPRGDDVAVTSVTSPISSATAATDTAACYVDNSVTSNHSEAVSRSTPGLAVSESDSRKSVEFSSKLLSSSLVASSSAVSSTCTLPPSHSTQPSSVFAFGQAAFAQNSSRPLGVPANSLLSFKAPVCAGL